MLVITKASHVLTAFRPPRCHRRSWPSPSRSVIRIGLAGLAVLSACKAPEPLAPPPRQPAMSRESDALAGLDRAVLEIMAADANVRARMRRRVPPSIAKRRASRALTLGDSTLMFVGDVPDVFSFSVRAQALDEARALVRAAARSGGRSGPAWANDRALLVESFVQVESMRLERERDSRDLGARAALWLDVAKYWQAPRTAGEIAEREMWLVRRLTETLHRFESAQPPDGIANEAMDDALDALERRLDGMPRAMGVVARLRVQLSEAPRVREPTPALRPDSLRLHLGERADLVALRASVVSAKHALRSELKEILPTLDDDAKERAKERATKIAASYDPCRLDGQGTRGAFVPRERESACRLIAVWGEIDRSRADHEESVVAALLATDAALGRAILALASADAGAAERGPGPADIVELDVPLAVESRLERWMAIDATDVIVAGRAAVAIARASEREAFAERWRRAGDAPIAMALRLLGPPPAKQSPRE